MLQALTPETTFWVVEILQQLQQASNQWFLKLQLATKQITPYGRECKTVREISFLTWYKFVLRWFRPFQRYERGYNLFLWKMSPGLEVLQNCVMIHLKYTPHVFETVHSTVYRVFLIKIPTVPNKTERVLQSELESMWNICIVWYSLATFINPWLKSRQFQC